MGSHKNLQTATDSRVASDRPRSILPIPFRVSSLSTVFSPRHVAKKPTYMETNTTGRLVKQWNLVVPSQVLDRSWEEPATR